MNALDYGVGGGPYRCRFSRESLIALASALVLSLLMLCVFPSAALAEGTLYSHWDSSSDTLSFYRAGAPSSQDDSEVATLKEAIDPHRSDVTTIDFSKAGSIALSGEETSSLFRDCTDLTNIVNLAALDTSQATDMSRMFEKCKKLEKVDAAGLETQNVTEIEGMFSECGSLASIDLSSWDLSNLRRCYSLFVNCKSLTSAKLPAIGGPNSKLSAVGHLFWGCTSLKEGDISSIDTRTITPETSSGTWASISAIFGGYYSGWGEESESYDAGLYKIVTGQNFFQSPGMQHTLFPKTMYRIDDGSHKQYASQENIPDGAGVYVVRAALALDGNGATQGSMGDTLLYYYSEGGSPLPKNIFRREGYTFLGWSSDPNATSATVKDQETLDFDAVTSKGHRVNGDEKGEEFAYTLYAVWAKNPTITFDSNGGKGSMDSVAVEYGTSSALPECAFTRRGYLFDGWNTAADGSGTAYADAALIAPTSDVTLYAQWREQTYTLTYDPAGGKWADGTTGNVTMSYGKASAPATILEAPTREGYKFVRWEGSSYQPGDTYDQKDDEGLLTDDYLTAVWEKASSNATNNNGTATKPSATKRDKVSSRVPGTGDCSAVPVSLVFGVASSIVLAAGIVTRRSSHRER